MKFNTLVITLGFALILCMGVLGKKNSHRNKHRNHHKHKHHAKSHTSQEVVDFFASNAQNYVTFARLAYCQKPVIQNLSCEFCSEFAGEYTTFFIHTIKKENNRVFQFVIVYSDVKREIVVSFSGPTTEHGNYFNSIYSSGFVEIPELGGIRVENEYWEIYSQHMRQILSEKILKISDSGRGDFAFTFVGHSFGGSLATLASYDMVLNNIVIKTENSPLVYTYGPLRIGDEEFVNKVNKLVKVIKILRKDDYVTRMPNCVYIQGKFRCFNKISQLVRRIPLIKKYLVGYRRAHSHIRPTVAVRRHGRLLSFLEKKKDPIVRGTTFINGVLHNTHIPMFYSQPFGTELIYNGPSFARPLPCRYVNGIPLCEKRVVLPATFSPDVHRVYYNINLEQC